MNRRIYIILIAAVFLVLIAMQLFVEQPVDWSASYSRYHKKPFGSFILYEELPELFPSAEIKTTRETVSSTVAGKSLFDTLYFNFERPQKTCYLFTSRHLNFYEQEIKNLLRFVHAGNHAFLASEDFPSLLLDTLGLETEDLAASLFADDSATTVHLLLNDEAPEMRYPFRTGTADFYFSKFPDSAQVISSDTAGNAVALSIPYGKGGLLLNTTPKAFTNYYMLKDTTEQYIARTLSYLPEDAQTVIWDEFYRIGRAEASSPLRFIITSPALKWAWYILLAFVILYVITGLKRRQRAIPVYAKPSNTTVEFVTTVGRLYFQQGDYQDIAGKKISYFLDDLRRRYFLRSIDFSESSAERVALKSGVPKDDVLAFFNFIRNTEQQISSEVQLLTLNQVIENFYKKAK